MDGHRFPACRYSDFHRTLSAWWSEKLFAGSRERPFKESRLKSSLPVIILALLSTLLLFGRLGCPLLEPEEARYAEIPRQMLVEGRWIVPVLHGDDYLQKPPLLYWLIMICYQIFGVHDWAARLVPGITGILVVLVTYGWSRRALGPRAALASGFILCLSAQFLYLAGMVAMDSLLCLWVIGGLASGHLALSPPQNESQTTKIKEKSLAPSWWLTSALCCGLGVMTKGPVAVVLVVGPLAGWLFLERRRARVGLTSRAGYLAVVLLVAGPWYMAVSLRDPQATGSFFWLHNIVRYLAPFDHEKPAWFYLPGLAIGTLPWALLLVALVPYLARRSPRWALRRPAALGFVLLAFSWCLIFFSLSGCKRTAYILPALPLLAMILGTCAARAFPWNHRTRRTAALAAGTMALALLAACHFALPVYHRHFALRGQVRRHAGLKMPVVCYPKRWDSVSFYLGREAILFGTRERDQLMKQLQTGATLLFIKNDQSFNEMLQALPGELEFVPRGRQGRNVHVGVVQRKVQNGS
jgi:4-amino-4-deoxy-L-arabinose transferase-like glycosyltransferase